MGILHEEHNLNGDLIVFRCTECGEHYLSIGAMHAHTNGHQGYFKWLYHHLPIVGDPFELGMRKTEVLRVTDTELVSFSEID